MLLVLTIVACGGGSAPPAEQAPGPGVAGSEISSAVPPTRRFNTLNIRAKGNSALPADCVARVGAAELVVIRGDEVRWRVRNAMGNLSCEGLEMATLELVFERDVFREGGKRTNRLTAMAGDRGIEVVGQIDNDRSSEGLWKYVVCYNGAQASEDPWLDIYGDEEQPIRPEGDFAATTTMPSC